MKNISREFQIFVKPVGPACNLGCTYCYYTGKDKSNDYGFSLMDDNVLEEYIRQHIEASTDDVIFFSWHGGEPLLAGIGFYRKVLKFQSLYKPPDKRILNGIQTNGTLIDDEWCRFISGEGFIVGMSIDGPQQLHDTFRLYKNTAPSWHRVRKGFKLLRKYAVIPEILCVVNAVNVGYPDEIYDFFKEEGAKFITFLPLVELDLTTPSGVSKDSVPAEAFGYFLSRVFDRWVENDIGEIKIQIFEEAARTAFGQDHTLCIFKTDCGGVPVIEKNGDFFCCDHYVNSGHFLGNIMDHSITDFLDSERQKAFGKVKSLTLPDYCAGCEVRPMCNGECPRNRFILTPDGKPGLNYLCQGYRYFFNHCRPFIEAIAEAWKKQQG